jgi:hypothetical protein
LLNLLNVYWVLSAAPHLGDPKRRVMAKQLHAWHWRMTVMTTSFNPNGKKGEHDHMAAVGCDDI